MAVYKVIEKASGKEVTRYTYEAAVEWLGMEFATHDHVEVPPAPPEPEVAYDPAAWRINVGPFFDRFGDLKISILASTDPLVQAVVKDASVREYIDLKGRRVELLKAIGLLKSKGFDVSVSAVLDAQPLDGEVHRG